MFVISITLSLIILNLNKMLEFFNIKNERIINIVTHIYELCVMFETLIHELGHSVMSVINGGDTSKMKINKNGSGEVRTSNLTLKGATLTLLSGYTFSALFFTIALILIIKDFEYIVIIALLLILIICTLFIIRNLQGLVFSVVNIIIMFVFLGFVEKSVVFIPFVITFIVVSAIIGNIKSIIYLIKTTKNENTYSGDCEILEKIYSDNNYLEFENEKKNSFMYNKKASFFANIITLISLMIYLLGIVIIIIL